MDELSIIVPVRGATLAFRRSLEALAALEPPPLEIIVVNEGPDPLVRELCRRLPVRHLEAELSPGNEPGRNLGAVHAGGELLLFLEPETVVSSDLVFQIEASFEDNPHLSALVGSFDASPSDQGFFSQFESLSLFFAHQNAGRSTDRFSTAFGVIRREVFFVLGGFDRVTNPGLELGRRLKARGFEIELRSDLHANSLKLWNFAEALQASVFQRGIPSADLLWRYPARLRSLDVKARDLAARALALLVLPLLVVGFRGTGLNWVALSVTPLWIALNWPLYSFFLRRRGPRFLGAAVAWHWLTTFLETAGFCFGTARAWAAGAPSRETYLHEVSV